jgi:hypothetical protein
MSTRSSAPTSFVGAPANNIGSYLQGLISDIIGDLIPALTWPESVITYNRMRRDPQISGVLRACTLPVRRANWAIDPGPASDEVVQHVASDLGLPVLGQDDENDADPIGGAARTSGVIWQRHLAQAMGYQTFGAMGFERRYKITPDGAAHLDALGQRPPWTISDIKVGRDGTVQQVVQTTQDQPIPGNRLVWYVNDQEGALWSGVSALVSAYAPWLLKHEMWRVHATSIRRFGMGVPSVEAPPGATGAEVTNAQQLASAMRVGETTGAGLPNGYKFSLTGLTGSVPDALAFIQYLDQQISKQALAGIVDLGQTEVGSRALGETFLDLFTLALQAVADEIATTATSGWPGMPGIVTDLVAQNWGEDEPCPSVVCIGVGQQHEITAQALQLLTQYGALTPDPKLEAFIRRSWRIPQVDPKFVKKPPQDDPAVLPAPRLDQPKAPGTASPVARRRQPAAAAPGPWKPRRQPTVAEAASGIDFGSVRRDFEYELGQLLTAWGTVFRAQRDAIVDQVVDTVQAGKTADLAGLTVDSGPGAQLLADAMQRLSRTAAQRVVAEAESQGKNGLRSADAKIDDSRLQNVAAARAALAGQYMCQQASGKALQVAASAVRIRAAEADDVDEEDDGQDDSGREPDEVGDLVATFLSGLSQDSLRDQLGSALMSAQNAGRMGAMAAAEDLYGQPRYQATEYNDQNTCTTCVAEDGREFTSLKEANDNYPNGGYIECLAALRCRGTVVAIW